MAERKKKRKSIAGGLRVDPGYRFYSYQCIIFMLNMCNVCCFDLNLTRNVFCESSSNISSYLLILTVCFVCAICALRIGFVLFGFRFGFLFVRYGPLYIEIVQGE